MTGWAKEFPSTFITIWREQCSQNRIRLWEEKKSENSIETEFDAKYWVCCYTDSQELSNCHGNFYHQEVIGWQSSWFEIILGSQDSISHHESKFHTNDCQICCQLFCHLFFFLYSIEYEAPLKKIMEKEIIASARTRVCKPKCKINLKTISWDLYVLKNLF